MTAKLIIIINLYVMVEVLMIVKNELIVWDMYCGRDLHIFL
jgi:hypothetical protein